MYDSIHGGFEESKNEAEARIQEDTPWLKPRHCFTGRDEFLFDGDGDIEDRVELGVYERLNLLTEPLGTSDLNSTKLPYFSLTCLKGEIQGSSDYMTGSTRLENTGSIAAASSYVPYSQQLLKIPQIEMDVEYKIAVMDPEDSSIKFNVDRSLSTNRVYKNGMSVVVGPEEILLLIEEGNTTCDHKNFDIEVFEMTGLAGSLGEEIMTPLSFVRPLDMVENNILLSPAEARKKSGLLLGPVELDSSYVEYYFNIDVDNEIDKNVICKSLSKIKKQGRSIYSPCGVDFDCPDLEEVIGMDIYASDADLDNC